MANVDELTAEEAAAILGCSRSTIARMARIGRLKPSRKLPGLRGPYLFRRADVEKLRDEMAAAS